MKKALKVIGIIFGSLIAVLLVIWGGLNLAKPLIYPEYFDRKTDICENPGLSDGFVCQGIAAAESYGKILVSGYMKDDSASRIYVTNTENESYFVNILENGKDFTGHAGGISVSGDKVYIASGSAIRIASLPDLMNAKNGDTLEITEKIEVNNSASFSYCDDTYLYVGEFHDGGKYVTDHPYDTAEGKHFAIVTRYKLDDLTKPDRVYSIRDKVQGICFMPNGNVVMSTSYGLTSSVYYVYREADATDSGETLDGAPVYFLDKLQYEFSGPAMAEGLDFYDGKVITLTESASDKYIFGKFFFANKIVGLEID